MSLQTITYKLLYFHENGPTIHACMHELTVLAICKHWIIYLQMLARTIIYII